MKRIQFCILVFLLGALLEPALADDSKFDIYKQLYQEVKPGQIEAFLKAYASVLGATPHKITKTVDGIVFDSNYDNGSLLDVEAAGSSTFNCSLYVEPGVLGTRQGWFRFRMTGVANRTITLNIDSSQSPRQVIRVEGGSWRRLTAAESPQSDVMVLDFGAAENEAEVAAFFPLGYAETYEHVAQLIGPSIHAATEVIGQSYEGREMWMVTVTDRSVPDSGKYRVWVHSRAHAGEVTSTHAILGILEQAIEDSPLGELLRERCIFNIVPLQNIDGVYLGHTRWDSRGIDPERQWCADQIPEAANIKAQVDGFMAGPNPIRVALNLHSTFGSFEDTFFFKHLYPSVSLEFEEIEQRFIDAFRNATPLFDNRNPQTSQLHACQFIESYFWNNWGEDVMALTHEGHYYRRITDGEYITDADYQEIGKGLATALVEYFGLLEPQRMVHMQVY